jgi:hypothetical protein
MKPRVQVDRSMFMGLKIAGMFSISSLLDDMKLDCSIPRYVGANTYNTALVMGKRQR